MNSKLIAIAALSPFIAQAAQANTVTADSPTWGQDTTVTAGASYTQYPTVQKVEKTRTVQVPEIPGSSYFNAHGDLIHIEAVEGYSYSEKYTTYETSQADKYRGSVELAQKLSPNLLGRVGYDNLAYVGLAYKAGPLVVSSQLHTNREINSAISYSPVANTALIANYNRFASFSYGVQQQFGDTSAHALYSPSTGGFKVGLAYSFGSGPAPVPVITKAPDVKPPQVKVPEAKPPIVKPKKYVRGRG